MKFSRPDSLDWLEAELSALEGQGLLRKLHAHAARHAAHLGDEGRTLIDFGSNDYLGLSTDSRIADAVAEAVERFGWGAGASPLVTGHTAAHRALEHKIAAFEQTEAALVFPSGYAANVGTIAALAGPGDVIYSDAKNHASMIDGCRLSRAEVRVYPHRDLSQLERFLSTDPHFRRRLIITESVFSMDGDLAPLAELASLANRFGTMLLVDEAHATGVLGVHGRGLAEVAGIEEQVPVRIGTLSKAVGSVGGFVAGSQRLIDWLVNRARTCIYSTALPPAACAAATKALELIEGESTRRQNLLETAAQLRYDLTAQGWTIGDSQSQIIPLLLRDSIQVTLLSAKLRDRGLWVPAIRPPSVPVDGALLRISLTSAHEPGMIEQLTSSLASLRLEFLDSAVR